MTARRGISVELKRRIDYTHTTRLGGGNGQEKTKRHDKKRKEKKSLLTLDRIKRRAMNLTPPQPSCTQPRHRYAMSPLCHVTGPATLHHLRGPYITPARPKK